MTKRKYKTVILSQLSELNIKKDGFDSTIDALAGILEQRDKTFKEFQESGGASVIEYTNKGGSTNMVKNPLLAVWDDLNKTALAYWRELGLTPAAYKKISGEGASRDGEPKGLAKALAELQG